MESEFARKGNLQRDSAFDGRALAAIANAAGTTLANAVKTTVLFTDLGHISENNKVYASFFSKPYPAQACFEVKALPKGAKVEIEAVIALP